MERFKTLAVALLGLLAVSAAPPNTDTLAPPTLAPPALAPPAAAPVVGQPTTPASTAIPAPSGANPLTKADVDSWLDGYLPYALRVDDIAGADVSVVKDGHILTARGYGFSDVAKRVPVDPDRTLFRPGSVSKLATWTAVMQLVGQHQLDLDRDVNAYLDFTIPSYHGQPVTLRQIMTHTAGFNETGKLIISYDPKDVETLGAYLKGSIPERIYAPGSTPAYSNWATTLAGYIVERVSRTPFDDYVEQHVFAPLGMRNSTFRQPLPAQLASQMSTGYDRASEPGRSFEFIIPAPAGAESSTATDMARFMIAHLQDGILDGQRILDPATAQMMHDSPLAKVDPASLIPPLNRMELGFFETNINGHEVIGHLGDTANFHTILHLFMKDGVGLYASFNSVGKDGAVQGLRNSLFKDFADRYFPSTGQDGSVAPQLAAQHARMMVGRWQASRKAVGNFLNVATLLGQTTISIGPKGELVVSGITEPGGGLRHWTEIAPFVWREVGGHDRLAAKVVDGRVVRWSWDFMSPFEVMDPVPAGRSAGWILPSLEAGLAVLLLSFLHWPVAALVRRRYRTPLPVPEPARPAYRIARLFAGLSVAVMVWWAMLILSMLKNASPSDAVLWAVQVAGLLVFVLAMLAMLWNLWLAWRARRGWFGRVWSVLMVLSSLMLLYFASTFGLLAMTVNY